VARPSLDRARFVWHDVRHFAYRVYEGAADSRIAFLASALAFDALLAAIPFVLLLLAVAGSILSAGAGRAQIALHDYLHTFFPSDPGRQSAFEPIITIIERIAGERRQLELVGLPLFVWFATRLYSSLRAALCEIFDVEETRSWIRGKSVDIGLVLLTTALGVANSVLSEGVTVMARTRPGFGFLAYFGAQLVAFVVILVLFVAIFRLAPAHPVKWDTALVAALVCAVSFEVARQVLSLYFENMVHFETIVRNATLAAVLLFVFWTYYVTFVFLIGAQIAQVYELRRRQAAQRVLLH